MKKFEYLTVDEGDFYSKKEEGTIKGEITEFLERIGHLNKLGAEGWEVVCSYRNSVMIRQVSFLKENYHKKSHSLNWLKVLFVFWEFIN